MPFTTIRSLRSRMAEFEAENWGWTYHVWRGWEGWDAEILGNFAQGAATALDRQAVTPSLTVLKAAMAANP